MRVALIAVAAVAALVLWRRRGTDTTQVVVAWQDGAELAVAEGTPEHARLVAVAGRALA